MNRWRIPGAIFLLAGAILAGCQRSSSSNDKEYPIKGKVVEVGKETVRLDHEAIPGYMGAMEMEFAVSKPELLEGLQPGDQVEGALSTASGQAVITRLKKN